MVIKTNKGIICASIRVQGNTKGIYIDSNCKAYIDITKATNFNDVDFEGANGIAVHREKDGTMRIISVSGYTYEKGLYTTTYCQ